MGDYDKLIQEHYKSLSSKEFENGSVEHAKILVKYLFKMALSKKLDMKMISGCLNGEFYDNFTESAKKLLAGGNRISLISVKSPDEGSFKDVLKSDNSGNASIIVADDKVDSLPHFILVGDSAYRFENSDILCTAQASFNKPSMGKFLNFLFEDIRKSLTA